MSSECPVIPGSRKCDACCTTTERVPFLSASCLLCAITVVGRRPRSPYLRDATALWAIIPSPEARASKVGQQRFRAGSDLDLLALKALYDTRTPSSPNPAANGPFSVDAFVSCVHALIADDRALIERLVRFPQAHDLLKKNAEHAAEARAGGQRCARDVPEAGAHARGAECGARGKGRGTTGGGRGAAGYRRARGYGEAGRRDARGEQAATCTQLRDANNALSARTLALAEEATGAPEAVRKQLEAQLAVLVRRPLLKASK
ncbi:hypothetical protein B0H19DRAFT_649526 [Mycena capillaripes]|nr:hypothetical protein B0H19DRAFT_649526 [Mycena capillaripes]